MTKVPVPVVAVKGFRVSVVTLATVGGENVVKVAGGLLSVTHTRTEEYMYFKCSHYCLRVNLSRIEITADNCCHTPHLVANTSVQKTLLILPWC